MKFNVLFIITLFLLPLTVAVGSPESKHNEQVKQLLGCYTEGEAGIVLELKERQQKYVAILYDNGNKVETIDVHFGDRRELMANYFLMPDVVGRIKANLIAEDVAFGVFLVNPGDEVAGEVAKTNYLGVLIMGLASLNKIPCK
jgi:hypothetical protein